MVWRTGGHGRSGEREYRGDDADELRARARLACVRRVAFVGRPFTRHVAKDLETTGRGFGKEEGIMAGCVDAWSEVKARAIPC